MSHTCSAQYICVTHSQWACILSGCGSSACHVYLCFCLLFIRQCLIYVDIWPESTWRVIIGEDIKRCEACVMNFPDGWHDGVVFFLALLHTLFFLIVFQVYRSHFDWCLRSVVRRCNTVLQLILSVLTGDLSAANPGRNHTAARRRLMQ